MWYLYTMEIYLTTKKTDILSFASKWVEVENIILSKVSQVQKAKKSHFLPHMWIIDLKKNSVILLAMGHMLGRTSTGRIGKGKET
jgi:hypothetical protein